MNDEAMVVCPYCFEQQVVVLDPETSGSFVQDCEVCCHPWDVRVDRDEEGNLQVTVDRV